MRDLILIRLYLLEKKYCVRFYLDFLVFIDRQTQILDIKKKEKTKRTNFNEKLLILIQVLTTGPSPLLTGSCFSIWTNAGSINWKHKINVSYIIHVYQDFLNFVRKVPLHLNMYNSQKDLKEALATILTKKIICFGNW